jgi:ribosome-binding protein aMBF1 (putative translation factor)
MLKKFCDFCGREIEADICLEIKCNTGMNYDVCDECTRQLKHFVSFLNMSAYSGDKIDVRLIKDDQET